MKTLLFSPMWLDSTEEDSIRRHLKWIDFMQPLQYKLGFDQILFVDNASSKEKINTLTDKYPTLDIHRFETHIPRQGHLKYGYWYAALAMAGRYAIDNEYDKIIYIDTDMYPLSERMCQYTKDIKKGWTGLWCAHFNFPETNYQIIGKDKILAFYNFHSRDFLAFYPDKAAESQTPFTHIEKNLIGDRYGEMGNDGLDQTSDMDYYGQCRVDKELKFGY